MVEPRDGDLCLVHGLWLGYDVLDPGNKKTVSRISGVEVS